MKKTTLDVEVYEKAPSDFKAQEEVSACFLEVRGRLLLLQATSKSQEPDRWGVPAGKVEKRESAEAAAIRELEEETGIHSSGVQELGSLYMRKKEKDYLFHLFKFDLEEKESVTLSDAHEGYLWASEEDLEVLPLMAGAEKTLQFYRGMLSE